MSRSKHTLSDEEKAQLLALMEDVKPLVKKPRAEKPAAPQPRRRAISLKDAVDIPAFSAPKGKADSATVKRLSQGEFAIDAKLDLHGMTLVDAHKKLVSFIEKQHHKGARCVLVITGKGNPGQLQREVPRWLSLSDMAARILVVSTASAKHGGSGALYVLLRRYQ